MLLVVDGLAPEHAREFALHMCAVATAARRENLTPALLQTVLSCQEKLAGPAGPRACVKLGRLTVTEQQAVCRRWFARFGKENVSDDQVNKVVRKAASHLPLYIVLFCAEAASHSIFETINEAMDTYPDEIPSMWQYRVLARLEGLHEGNAPIVKHLMQHLLATTGSVQLQQIKASAAKDKLLCTVTMNAAELSRRMDEMIAILRPFLYSSALSTGGTHGECIALHHRVLREASMYHYAPKVARLFAARRGLEKLLKESEGLWGQSRTSVVQRSSASVPATLHGLASEWVYDWVFFNMHRNLQVKMNGRQLSCLGGEVVSALVQPEADKKRKSYFEVQIEGCDKDCSIKVGIFIVTNDRDLKLVPDKLAASQQKGGWFYNCKNGNIVNNANGNQWIKPSTSAQGLATKGVPAQEITSNIAKGHTVGVLLDPVTASVFVYVQGKALPQAMPLSEAAKTAIGPESPAKVYFCVDLDEREQTVRITNHHETK